MHYFRRYPTPNYHEMKRQQDRDNSPGSKLPRSTMSRFEGSPRDRLNTPERERRGEGRAAKPSPSHRGGATTAAAAAAFNPRHPSSGGGKSRDLGGGRTPHELRGDDFGRRGTPAPYKVLCVSNVNPKVSDVVVKDVLAREFKRFGEASVKVTLDGSERVAYIYFRNPDDAREARLNKNRALVFDKPVNVDPVFAEPAAVVVPERRGRKSFSPDNGGGGGVLYSRPPRGASPTLSNSSVNSMNRRGRHGSVERAGLPPLPRDGPYRRDPLGSHHDVHHVHRNDEKKEKFPNYLHHIPPEEDDKATRTLFIGNLEVNIQESDLRRIFEHYGVVEDIDVKRPPPGQGNAYAFIKFLNLDMAHRAKVEMSGQYIGKFQCKIGYGKATPTTRIWVGGLGPWTSLSHLEREFDRFGAIKKIDFVKGDNHAYILYDSIDAAQAACQEMRGFPMGGPDRRLRVDFADTTPYNYRQPSPRNSFREEATERYVHPRRFEHEHPNQRTTDYYGGGGQEQDYAQWNSTTAANNTANANNTYVNQQYDSYYDRNQRPARNDSWNNYGGERGERHVNNAEFRSWNRDRQTVWRDDGPPPRDWQERRKRPRSPDGGAREDRPREGNLKHVRRTPDGLPPDHDRALGNRGRTSPAPFADQAHRENREPDGVMPSPKDRRYNFFGGGGEADKTERDRTRRDELQDDRTREAGGGSDARNNGFASSASHSAAVTTLQEVSRSFPAAWLGGLVLKNSAFPVRMHSCAGDVALVEAMMKDDTTKETPMLRITQRLRLDQPKVDDVSRRIESAGHTGHCILVGFPGTVTMGEDAANAIQQRPLRNLVSYLKQKEAAGVIALPLRRVEAQDAKDSGVLYAFPPCTFSHELLKRIVPSLTDEGLKEDHLVVVVVKGAI